MAVAKIFFRLIQSGHYTIDQVPASYVDYVLQYLAEDEEAKKK